MSPNSNRFQFHFVLQAEQLKFAMFFSRSLVVLCIALVAVVSSSKDLTFQQFVNNEYDCQNGTAMASGIMQIIQQFLEENNINMILSTYKARVGEGGGSGSEQYTSEEEEIVAPMICSLKLKNKLLS